MLSHIMTVAVVNFHPSFGDKETNLFRMIGFVKAAARQGADLVLFPELCLMGYDYFLSAGVSREEMVIATETVDGPSVARLAEVAQSLGIYVVFGMSEKLSEGDETLYNSAVALGPKGVIGAYQKIHPFDREKTWCAKGETPFLFDTEWGPIGVGICYDSYAFPELLRYYAYRGARLYLNPTALVQEITKDGSRDAFCRSYTPYLECGVKQNGIFIASANLTGYDRDHFFGGGSLVIGPKISPFDEVDSEMYGGSDENTRVGVSLATLDLSLAKRQIYIPDRYTGKPDYRPEIYRRFQENDA